MKMASPTAEKNQKDESTLGDGANPGEEKLESMECLDRQSPELWPETVPGVKNLVGRPVARKEPEWMKDFDGEDYEMLTKLVKKPPTALLGQVTKLFDEAFHLSVEESNEIARSKMLQILISKENKQSESGDK